MVAMQCLFCVFWQDNDINCSDTIRFLWPDSDISGSEAVRVLCIFGRTVITIVAMRCVFFMAFLWQDDINCSDAMRVFLWPDNDINGSDAVRVLCILTGKRYQP